MRTTHTSQRGSLTSKVPSNQEITIISAGNSSDALISYINFMRQRLNLTPLALDPALCSKARRKAQDLEKKSVLLLKPQLASHQTEKLIATHQKTYLIASPIIESHQYLNYVLSHHCSSVGIHTSKKKSGAGVDSFTIQVLNLAE